MTKIRCRVCGHEMPDVGFDACASCAYGSDWSKSSIGAGKRSEEVAMRRQRIRESGLEVVG